MYCNDAFHIVGPTYIIYSKEHSDAVLELSNFLREPCGINCDIDQYHMNDNIADWGVWNENNIKQYAKDNGFVLLICSSTMLKHLSNPDIYPCIQMGAGYINTLALNALIRDATVTRCIIPVCFDKTSIKTIPSSLRGRTSYSLPYNKLMQIDPSTDINTILNKPELGSLRSLVFRLRGEPEVNKPPVGKTYHIKTHDSELQG